jgi:hypothetical protein
MEPAMRQSDLFDPELPASDPALAEGDIVLCGPTGALALEVIALRHGKAWVRDLEGGRDGVVKVTAFRRFALGAAEMLQ